jgi:hemoglobin-like flavoprotein
MALDPDVLEESFDLVAPRGGDLVEIFYSRLFAAAPAVRPLFAETNMDIQRAKLLATLVLLRNVDTIVPKLRELGAQHATYGAEAAHYPVVGEVLIASMAEVAGDAWRPRYEQAWAEAIGVVAGAMLEGAAAARLEGAA